MYIVEQLSHNLEYIRHHDENIMGYNDYQAISNGNLSFFPNFI